MTTFSDVSYEQFKSEAKKLLDCAPTLGTEQRASGFKALALLYVGRKREDWLDFEKENAEMTLEIASRACEPRVNPVKRAVDVFEGFMEEVINSNRF